MQKRFCSLFTFADISQILLPILFWTSFTGNAGIDVVSLADELPTKFLKISESSEPTEISEDSENLSSLLEYFCRHSSAQSRGHYEFTEPGRNILSCWEQLAYLLFGKLKNLYKIVILDLDETIFLQKNGIYSLTQTDLHIFLKELVKVFNENPDFGEIHIVTSRYPEELEDVLSVLQKFDIPITKDNIHFVSKKPNKKKPKKVQAR